MDEERTPIEKMIDEIVKLRQKHGLPKSMAFLPNKINISLTRNSVDSFELIYDEYFTYLPLPIQDIALDNAISGLIQMGLPSESITRLDNGVKLNINGDWWKISSAFIELYIQNYRMNEDMEAYFKHMKNMINMNSKLMEYEYVYSAETYERMLSNLETIQKTMLENPSIIKEIEEIQKKYDDELSDLFEG